MKIRNLFHRRKQQTETKETAEPEPLVLDGIGTAPITPEADNAELAAQALMEIIIGKRQKHRRKRKEPDDDITPDSPHDARYYHHLADRIRLAYDSSRLRATRFVAFCEQELRRRDLPLTGKGSVQMLETELYKRIDIVEREGGKLKERWQHCLADVTVRLMNIPDEPAKADENSSDKPKK